MRYANEATWNEFTLAAGVVAKILAPNPRRWAVGFTLRTGAAIDTRISNNPNPNIYGISVNDQLDDNWYTIFTYGPQIQQEWYAFCGVPLAIGWWEVEMGDIQNEQ